MRHLRHGISVCIVLCLCLFGFSGETESDIQMILNAKRFESGPMFLGEDKELPDIPIPVKPAYGPHVRLGKAAEWVVNHSVRTNGWSFSGWSKTGLDEDFRPWRLHIGIISGELDVNTAYDLAEKSRWTPRYKLLEEWEHKRTNELVFGIVFTKRF